MAYTLLQLQRAVEGRTFTVQLAAELARRVRAEGRGRFTIHAGTLPGTYVSGCGFDDEREKPDQGGSVRNPQEADLVATIASQLGMGARSAFRLIEWPALRASLPGIAGLVFMLCITSFTMGRKEGSL